MREGPHSVDPSPNASCTGGGKPPVPGTEGKHWITHIGQCPDCGMVVQIGWHVERNKGLCFIHLPMRERTREEIARRARLRSQR